MNPSQRPSAKPTASGVGGVQGSFIDFRLKVRRMPSSVATGGSSAIPSILVDKISQKLGYSNSTGPLPVSNTSSPDLSFAEEEDVFNNARMLNPDQPKNLSESTRKPLSMTEKTALQHQEDTAGSESSLEGSEVSRPSSDVILEKRTDSTQIDEILALLSSSADLTPAAPSFASAPVAPAVQHPSPVPNQPLEEMQLDLFDNLVETFSQPIKAQDTPQQSSTLTQSKVLSEDSPLSILPLTSSIELAHAMTTCDDDANAVGVKKEEEHQQDLLKLKNIDGPHALTRLSKYHTLKSVVLIGCAISDDDARLLGSALRDLSGLSQVCIRQSSMSGTSCTTVISFLFDFLYLSQPYA